MRAPPSRPKRGRAENGILTFKGVRFAAAPVAEGRFAPPAPVRAWYGERDALEFGPAAPQRTGRTGITVAPVAVHQGRQRLPVRFAESFVPVRHRLVLTSHAPFGGSTSSPTLALLGVQQRPELLRNGLTRAEDA